MNQTIVVTADYRAVPLKLAVVNYLQEQGYTVVDVGSTDASTRDNYVKRADAGVAAMRSHSANFGIFLCGSGTGICIRANRFKGIRAVWAHVPLLARYGREVNNANVLCLAGTLTTVADMQAMVDTFLTTPFGGGHRAERVQELDSEA
ncbi:MAG: RpiB/LacA/LacB family sugar-phosphate isomerase [Alphaproteobacteria bacterium]